jgi:CRISPR/Cas system-associated exonuclease Cas4 (RecB family)
MKITPDLFDAFLKCPTKCWLRVVGEPTSGNAYAEWVQAQNESYRAEAAKRLTADLPADECASPDRSVAVTSTAAIVSASDRAGS